MWLSRRARSRWFGTRGVEGKIAAAKWARLNERPFLGICLGFQCAAIEFARNELKMTEAHTTEINPDTKYPLVIDMPEHTQGDLGGTMRLGKRKTKFVENQPSIIQKLYGSPNFVEERHRHRYEINPEYVPKLEAAGMRFVGRDVDNVRMEIMELNRHPFYIGVQYHPEYLSNPMNPSAPFLGLILASTGKLNSFLNMEGASKTSTNDNSTEEYSTDEEEMATLVKNMSFQELKQANSSNNSDIGSSGDN